VGAGRQEEVALQVRNSIETTHFQALPGLAILIQAAFAQTLFYYAGSKCKTSKVLGCLRMGDDEAASAGIISFRATGEKGRREGN